ncbi:Serine/threonine-protein phosphatase PP1 [Tritrichomonas foetus]|uniref:Serine/threonine-protein phosphatase n=1 Tax=Tritrichomonas foetus TaxID=1144522 RepID=A0A1J4JJN1_9EUKA|nr:Serine/threonine-protein phosphatase PP1 [Tritrichomonas foetus]|eukprot:OHS97765.1 Serine/threonine-protein phosphatase PP1 [Tritrichomonas foetus]
MKGRVNKILQKLLKPVVQEGEYFESSISNDDLIWLCTAVTRVIRDEPTLLKLKPPLTICGDVHGQYKDVLRIFELGGAPPNTNYLFLGDYVGRGLNSIETISYLFALKVKYPNNIFLLRGNHETEEISRTDGFYQEFVDRRIEDTWFSFTEAFRYLPLAATVGNRIFCVHGGLSQNLKSIDQIEAIKRPLDIDEDSFVSDLVWSDPAEEGNGWQENDRGISVTYGPDVVDAFLQRHRFDLLCRAHQMAMDGYEFPFKGRQNCVTVFTAPNYCGEFMNAGALMRVEEDMTCSFEYLEPEEATREEEEEDI